jgi:hypothetical protein
MHGHKYAAIALALTVPVALAGGPAKAAPYDRDRPVCYMPVGDSPEKTRIVLNVKLHSSLGYGQAVYEADGKHSFVKDYKYNRMAVFDGAVVTSRGAYGQPKGAHLGGETYWVRDASDGAPTSPVEWDCTSAEYSATPSIWYCKIAGARSGDYNLQRLDYPDRYCNVFQDTYSEYPTK